MRLVYDGRLDYPGYFGAPSACRLRIFRPEAADGDALPVVVVENIRGTSITNMAEHLAAAVAMREFAGDGRPDGAAPFAWVEYYPEAAGLPAHASSVTFSHYLPVRDDAWGRPRLQWRLGSPSWRRVPPDQLPALLAEGRLVA